MHLCIEVCIVRHTYIRIRATKLSGTYVPLISHTFAVSMHYKCMHAVCVYCIFCARISNRRCVTSHLTQPRGDGRFPPV